MSRLRTRFPSLYRFAAFVALLAMLVPAVTSFVHHPASAQSLMRICGIDQHVKDGKDNTPTHKAPFCPICQTLQMLGNGFVPPDDVAVVALPVVAVRGIPVDRGFLLTAVFAPQARPRAPPVFV